MITDNELRRALKKSGFMGDEISVNKDSKLEDSGMDSLDMFNFFAEIEQLTGLEIPDEDFESLDTLEKIHLYIQENASK